MEEKEEVPQDTIYSISSSASPETSVAIREATEAIKKERETELELTSPESRKEATIHRLNAHRFSVRKVVAKTTLTGLENLDALAGAFSYACLVIAYEFCRQGNILNAVLFGAGAALSWILKHRLPQGPVASFLHSPVAQIKLTLVDLSRTIYNR